jgi:hypothetical protein
MATTLYDTDTLVGEQFDLAQGYASDQINAVQVYLTALSTLFATATMPSTDIDYDF